MASQFAPPGPGAWELDRSHYPSGATPISQWLLREGFREGFTTVFAELGIPAQGMGTAFVNGFMYTRLLPLLSPDKPPRRLPPAFVLKAATRLHPAFRKRNKVARKALRDRPSNEVVERWDREIRPKLQATNAAFQAFDVAGATDTALQAHVSELLDELRDNYVLHFWLHGHDLGPVARYLHTCLGWGLEANSVIEALAGASPATAKPLDTLCKLRELLEASETPITSLGELRASSDEAEALIDDYLTERGYVLATGYDLDARTLIEMPEVVFSTIRAASRPAVVNHAGLAGELRNRVTPPQRAKFDQLLGDARNVMDMRDDNGPLTIEWPLGLLRRALLSAGRRLVEQSSLHQADHLFEITHDEARDIFGSGLPSADVLSDRARERTMQSHLEPPHTIGPPEPEPPLSVLPPALAQVIAMTQTAIEHLGMAGDGPGEHLAGAGIGTQAYVGIARVADSADDALDRLEPGEILVVRATSPAFNAVLAIAGAVVTSDGGVLSHAAVLARELGIPAIIGAAGALDIADGSTIEVDPVAGLVRIIS